MIKPDNSDLPAVLTMQEAAHLLRCSRTWLYRQASAGRFPACRLGSDLRVLRDDALAWLRSQIVVQALPEAQEAVTASDPAVVPTSPPPQAQEAVLASEAAPAPRIPALTAVRGSAGVRLPPLGKGLSVDPAERQQRKDLVVQAVSRGSTITEAARLSSVSRSTVTKWLSEDPRFREAVREAARQEK